MAVKKMKYCVGGQWLESKTDKWMDVTDSSTGEVIAQVPCCTAQEVESAIAAADGKPTCAGCGATLAEGARFCPACGKSVEES